ncbi:MAG: NADH-quinone oxidoreductase subunit D [Candidatus Binatia bacterium]|nr:MAG: NADH-quinone oxidoreductase subunit D [Candidatus Binatia bacterium]
MKRPGAALPATQDPVETTFDLQMGPSHPATHGTIKFHLRLDGEVIVDCDVEIGYLHRAFEKMAEQGTWTQVIPYTDRLNYVSPLINNVGYVMAVEKLLGLEVPERCRYIRVMMSEISRITDHLTCLGMAATEAGAMTVGFLLNEAREFLYDIVEAVTGARVTVTYTRIGGVTNDLPADIRERVRAAFRHLDGILRDCDKLLTRNRIFYDRMAGVGVISPEDAISFGLTGPMLRATGVSYDVRKQQPYLVYDRLDFEVPLGSRGDNYDRFLCRFLEIEQSMRIVEQTLERMPEGPVSVQDPRYVLPPKQAVYRSIEGLMNHFKIIMEGIKVPPGEAYMAVEGANGELGFYVVSDGTGRPYRVRVRGPCFWGMSALGSMLRGHTVADIVTTFGMVNMIGGECDR